MSKEGRWVGTSQIKARVFAEARSWGGSWLRWDRVAQVEDEKRSLIFLKKAVTKKSAFFFFLRRGLWQLQHVINSIQKPCLAYHLDGESYSI